MNNPLSLMKKTCFRYGTMQGGKGFTLMEVVIGVTVLSVGLLAVGAMQIDFIRGNKFADDLTQGSFTTSNRIERTNNTTFENITSGTDTSTVLKGIQYAETWNVDSVDKDNDGDIDWWVIRARTDWSDPNPHSVSFTTNKSGW